MTKQPKLFRPRRVCCCCGASAAPLVPAPGEPVMLSISATIYRKGRGKGMQQAARAVVICEDCFGRAFAPSVLRVTREGESLVRALGESLTRCYSTLANEDSEPSPVPVPVGAGELF